MDTWGILLLSIDLVLMAGIIIILAKGRVPVLGSLVTSGEGSGTGAVESLRAELAAELEAARRASEELELSKRECEKYKKDLKEKNNVLVRLIGQARMKSPAKDTLTLDPEGPKGQEETHPDEDLYRKAARMCTMGTSPEKIAESLGMLAGEAELVSSINDFRT